jgi:hypothetical protein
MFVMRVAAQGIREQAARLNVMALLKRDHALLGGRLSS